jgi:hypothetical protein
VKLKTHIALLFTIVFLGKFIMIDANLISQFYDTDAISVLKPFCKKKQVVPSIGEEHFIDGANHSSFDIELMSFCTSLYSQELEEKENAEIQHQMWVQQNRPALVSAIFDISSPPPQV